MVQKDTQFVMKNHKVVQPFVPTDGLELYYDVKGKKNTDNYKDKLLDMSGNGRHGVLSNFAYEGVSGYRATTEGGLLLDDVDDKIVRPAIDGIEYTSASRNLVPPFDSGKWVLTGGASVSNNKLTMPSLGAVAFIDINWGYADSKLRFSGIFSASPLIQFAYYDKNDIQIGGNGWTTSNVNESTRFGGSLPYSPEQGDLLKTKRIRITINTNSTSTPLLPYTVAQLVVTTSIFDTISEYTPYIPLPIMTYQMNGNILSFEKDGTVKRTTKDENGNEVVVSRKGINLVRNGNFANGNSRWVSVASNQYVDGDFISNISNGQSTASSELQYVSLTNQDKYYISGSAMVTNSYCVDLSIRIYSLVIGSVVNPIANDWYSFSKIITADSYSTDIRGRHQYADTAIANGKVMNLKYPVIINLTQAYGAGNEPTLEYIQSHPEEFAWTPNPNDLIETFEIKNNLVGDLENLQGNDFEQHEDGVITYTNEAEEGSVVRVDIDGISDQPLRFRNATGEQVVITEHDQIDEDAIKKVEFQGNSVQLADKYREVSGTSVVIAPELHDKTVADKLVIGGNATQYTESSNVVTDGLEMWLSGRSFSNSPATTVWKDLTGVNNGTASGFEYRTNVYADVVSDFAGKIAGSVVENANIFKYNNNTSTLIEPSNVAYLQDSTAQTSRIYTLDGIGVSCGANVAGIIGKQLFSFNVIKAFEKIHGNIPSIDQTTSGKVNWLKENLASIALSWTGYGNSINGYKAYVRHWRVDSPTTGTWNDAFSATSTDSSPTTKTLLLNPSSVNMIDSNGFTHMLAYADASDGVTTSTIYTDYVSLTLKTSGASGSDGSGGVNFDGVDDYVAIPYKATETTMSQALTLETRFSIKTVPVGKESNIIDKNGFSNYRLGIALGGFIHTTAQIKKSDGVSYYIDDYGSTKFYPVIGTTYHVTYTISIPNKVIKLYINGSLFGQTSLNSNSSEIFLTQGVDTLVGKMVGSNYFDGNIYLARIYNRALSDAEILQNYNAGVAIPIPNIAMPQEVKHVNSGSKVLVHGKNLFNPKTMPISSIGVDADGQTLILSGGTYDRILEKTAWIPKTATNYTIVVDVVENTFNQSLFLKSDTRFPFDAFSSEMTAGFTGRKVVNVLSPSIPRNDTFGALWLWTNKQVTGTCRLKIMLLEGNFTSEQVGAYEAFRQIETAIPVTLKSIG